MRPMPFVAPGALALVLLACAACGSPNPSTSTGPAAVSAVASKPHYGGTLKIGAQAAADTILPLYAHSQGSTNALLFLYDGLVTVDWDFQVKPALAAKWEISSDGLTYTFHLRSNAKWSDGEPITSADAKLEYDLATNPATGASYKADYDIVAGTSAPDPYTFVYKLKEPNAAFLSSVVGGLAHAPLPAHVYGKIDPSQLQHMDFSKSLVTSGPYTLVEWKHDDHLKLASNKRWWHGRPYIETIYIKEYPSAQAVLIALQNGDVDTAHFLSTPMWLKLKDDARYNKIHNEADAFNWFVVNMKHPILSDVRVRKAIMYAWDRQTEADKLFHKEDVVAFSPIAWAMKWAFDPATELAYPHDPEMARKILDEAGWIMGPDGYRHKNGKTLEFTTGEIAGSEIAVKSFEIWQASLKEVGIKTDIRLLEFNVFFDKEKKGEFEVSGGGFGGGSDPDPYIFLHSNAIPPNGLNYGRFSDPQLDKLIEDARKTSDVEKRKQLYREIQKLCVDLVPDFWDNAPYNRNVINKRIHGVEFKKIGSGFSYMMVQEPQWYIAQ